MRTRTRTRTDTESSTGTRPPGPLARPGPRRRGIAAVEFAVSATVLFLVIVGIIEFSRLGMVSQLLTNAAREGCRVAVLQGTTSADVQTRINAVLANSGGSAGTVTAVSSDPGTAGVYVAPSNWDSSAGDTPITVTVRVPFSNVSWAAPFFLKTANVTASATLNSERP